jgi:hypothetical protein
VTIREAIVQLAIILWLIPALDALNRFHKPETDQ